MYKYRIYIDSTDYTSNCQNIGSLAINQEKNEENGALFFRGVLSEPITVTGAAYDYIVSIADICQEIDIRIDQHCSTGVETIFEGVSAITKCSFNTDNCVVDIEAAPDDAYRCVLDNIEKEVNILDNPVIIPNLSIKEGGNVEIIITPIASPPPDAAFWQLQSTFTVNGEDFELRARARITVDCLGGSPQQPPPYKGQVYNLYQDNCATGNNSIWWRNPTAVENIAFAAAFGFVFCTPIPCTPPAIPAGSQLINRATGVNTVLDGYLDIATYETQLGAEIKTIPNGRGLISTIDYMLAQIGCALTVKSNFFTLANNPVTGNPNTAAGLVLFEKSDVVRPDSTEKATKSLVTLGQILNDLSVLFNVRWYVDNATSELVIEHISTLTQAVGLDLTTYQGGLFIKNRGAFSYAVENIPLEEKFKFPLEAVGADFIGFPIVYNTQCSTVNEIIFQTQVIETELPRIFDNNEEGLDGLVLVSPETINNIGTNGTLAENGRITNIFVPNAPLGYGALLPDYYTWDRPLVEGEINNANTVFDSTQPLKEQQEIRLSFCCLNNFNPTEKVRTQLGDGEVKQSSYNLKTNTLSLTIGFEL